VLKQVETIETTIWVAVRMMEERKTFLEKIAKQHEERGLKSLSTQYQKNSSEPEEHIIKMKDLLVAISKD